MDRNRIITIEKQENLDPMQIQVQKLPHTLVIHLCEKTNQFFKGFERINIENLDTEEIVSMKSDEFIEALKKILKDIS